MILQRAEEFLSNIHQFYAWWNRPRLFSTDQFGHTMNTTYDHRNTTGDITQKVKKRDNKDRETKIPEQRAAKREKRERNTCKMHALLPKQSDGET